MSDLDIPAQDTEYIQIFKPPPPYPISYSTPDLARACPLGYIQNPVSFYLIYLFSFNNMCYILSRYILYITFLGKWFKS